MGDLLDEALERFEAIHRRAVRTDPATARLMALATAGSGARPSVRTVRFTGIVDRRFTFFANRTSGKGTQLEENPWAGLSFFWPALEQQIVIDGGVGVISERAADDLWRTRPRPAALMAWASDQSEAVGDPDALEERYREAAERFPDERVPRPPDWLAYGVRPTRIEFWQGVWEGRQQREAYVNTVTGWRFLKLNP